MPDKISDAERLLLIQKYLQLHSYYCENNYIIALNNFEKSGSRDFEDFQKLYAAKCKKQAFEEIYNDFHTILYKF